MAYNTPTQQQQVDATRERIDSVSSTFSYYESMLNNHILDAEAQAGQQRQNNTYQDKWSNDIQHKLNAYCGYMHTIEESISDELAYLADYKAKKIALVNDVMSYAYSNYRQGHIPLHEEIHAMAYSLDCEVSYLSNVESDLFYRLNHVVIDETSFDALDGQKSPDIIYFSYDPDDDVPTQLNPPEVDTLGCTYLDEWKSYSASYAQQYGGANGAGGTSRFVTDNRYAPLDILLRPEDRMFPLAYWPERQIHPNN